ncbi:MAG: hypothetical protein ACJAVK_000239 [Akkermansiaceae bacterium]|jgi:hypothetical protein
MIITKMTDLVNEGVAVRLFHAKEPGPRFRKDFDRYPALIESDLFERILCPRIHTKAISLHRVRQPDRSGPWGQESAAPKPLP